MGDAVAKSVACMMLPLRTRKAYEAALYRFTDDGRSGEFRIGVRAPDVDRVLARRRGRTAAFITAWNPRSGRKADRINAVAERCLRAAARRGGWTALDGEGVDEAGAWPSEKSLLIIGIGRRNAARLSRRFGQNAFVFLIRGRVPVLVDTRGHGHPRTLARPPRTGSIRHATTPPVAWRILGRG